MANILNIDGLTEEDIILLVEKGGQFVQFEYVISILIAASKQYSDIYFIRPGQKASDFASKYTNMSLFLGWWSIWGIFWTIEAINTNNKGGKDCTDVVMANVYILLEKKKEFIKSQQQIINQNQPTNQNNLEDKLKSLKEMFDQGVIDQEEYKALKDKKLENL